MPSAYILLCYLIAAVFVLAGLLNLIAPKFIRAEFDLWGYPPHLRIFVGLCEFASAALLASQFLPRAGLLLGLAVLIGVLFTFAKSKNIRPMEYPSVLIALIAIRR